MELEQDRMRLEIQVHCVNGLCLAYPQDLWCLSNVHPVCFYGGSPCLQWKNSEETVGESHKVSWTLLLCDHILANPHRATYYLGYVQKKILPEEHPTLVQSIFQFSLFFLIFVKINGGFLRLETIISKEAKIFPKN